MDHVNNTFPNDSKRFSKKRDRDHESSRESKNPHHLHPREVGNVTKVKLRLEKTMGTFGRCLKTTWEYVTSVKIGGRTFCSCCNKIISWEIDAARFCGHYYLGVWQSIWTSICFFFRRSNCNWCVVTNHGISLYGENWYASLALCDPIFPSLLPQFSLISWCVHSISSNSRTCE